MVRHWPTPKRHIGCSKRLILPVSSRCKRPVARRRGLLSCSSTAYYLPRNSLTEAFKLSQVPNKASLCEWKGRATYWEVADKATGEKVTSKVWSYESPTPSFVNIKGYL